MLCTRKLLLKTPIYFASIFEKILAASGATFCKPAKESVGQYKSTWSSSHQFICHSDNAVFHDPSDHLHTEEMKLLNKSTDCI
jgi:hypothetical protein